MTNAKDNGGPAFPPFHDPKNHASGMTLRDHFAGQALAGLMSHGTIEYLTPANIAERTYEYANAMLEARK